MNETIGDLKENKRKLELVLTGIVNEFEETYGVSISSVELTKINASTILKPLHVINRIQLKIEL